MKLFCEGLGWGWSLFEVYMLAMAATEWTRSNPAKAMAWLRYAAVFAMLGGMGAVLAGMLLHAVELFFNDPEDTPIAGLVVVMCGFAVAFLGCVAVSLAEEVGIRYGLIEYREEQ